MPATLPHTYAADTAPVAAATTKAGRVVSIDVMRGLVMALMALDHVRVYTPR